MVRPLVVVETAAAAEGASAMARVPPVVVIMVRRVIFVFMGPPGHLMGGCRFYLRFERPVASQGRTNDHQSLEPDSKPSPKITPLSRAPMSSAPLSGRVEARRWRKYWLTGE